MSPSPRSSGPLPRQTNWPRPRAWIANDEPLMNAGKPLPSGRVGELILAELEADEDDEVVKTR